MDKNWSVHVHKNIQLGESYLLTLSRSMEFSIKLHTIKSGSSIVYFEGS